MREVRRGWVVSWMVVAIAVGQSRCGPAVTPQPKVAAAPPDAKADTEAEATVRAPLPHVSSSHTAKNGTVAGAAVATPMADSAPTKKVGAPGRSESAASGRGVAAPHKVAAAVAVEPALRAGRHDDGKAFNRFLAFLQDNAAWVEFPVDISERLVLQVVDQNNQSLPNCQVAISAADLTTNQLQVVTEATTFADGRTQFFPAAQPLAKAAQYDVDVTCGAQLRGRQSVQRVGLREVVVPLKGVRQLPQRVPVDIALVVDTTGSMQPQIDRLKATLKAIHFQLTQLSTKPDIRFALVAYRDRGDAYVTRLASFTADVAAFSSVLDELSADGGGDAPEDLQSALAEAMHSLKWRREALRLGFIVADAPPHTDYEQSYHYVAAMQESLRRGIKWTAIGAGGLDRRGEVVFRRIAQFSMGEYVFITSAATPGDHEGDTGEASHHVGANYVAENLDQALVRIVRRELSYLTNTPLDFDDTIVARGAAGDSPAEHDVAAQAMGEAVRQLVDYSALQLAAAMPTVVLPVQGGRALPNTLAPYLTQQLMLAASRHKALRLLERDLAAVAAEMRLQMSEWVDAAQAVPLGRVVGAELIIAATLVPRNAGSADKRAYDLFAKLVRVETGEILSVAKVALE